jgi:hypothetical protein
MKIILLPLAVLFLLSTGCVWFTAEEQIEVPAGISADSVDYEAYAGCIRECDSCESDCLDRVYFQKALSDENKNVCSQIMSTVLKQDCEQTILAAEAVSQLNKEKCSQLTEEALQQTCLVSVTAEIAVQSGSVEKCVEATDVERCENIFYKDMAIMNNDVTYCDHLSAEQKTVCYEVVGIAGSVE